MINREEFDRQFKQVNASWAYEDAEMNNQEKELIFKRLNGEISEEEFNKTNTKSADDPENAAAGVNRKINTKGGGDFGDERPDEKI